MLRKLHLIILLSGFSFFSIATPVDIAVAEKVAANFLKLKSQQYFLAYNVNNNIKQVISLKQGETLAYAVNFSDGGFVLVSADDAAKPVLGYSYNGEFIIADMPEVVSQWMQFYYSQILDIRNNNIPATESIRQEWNDLLNMNITGERDLREVSPLLSTTWDQGARYNDLCPEDAGGPGGRVWSGCVATAMSQVINYWRYPLQGAGSHGYYSNYGYLSADFGASTYDYNQMNANIAGEHNYEMAEIQYHCGVAVDMMYSPSGSGAYSDDAAYALRTYFGYSADLNLEYKDSYSDAAWRDLLISNLDNSWPMYYHGFGTGGHAFNVDGYQGTDYFHFNWGWSGSYNGYFYLTNLNPGGNNFTVGQGAIVNFRPNSANYPYYCSGVTTLTRHNGTIEDGSGPVDNYINGLNCGWLISPEDSVSGLTLYFDKFDLASGDVLNIFDGENSSAPLIGTYTGNTLPANITPSSGLIYIEFLTSGNLGKGWKAHYISYPVNYCSGIDNHNAPSGTFTDGSGNREYRNSSVCKYIIEPENASSITVTFDSFETEAGTDKVKVYDMISQTLLAEYSGTQLPANVTIPSGKAYILFVTNSSVTAPGWQLSYSSTITDIDELTIGNINLYCSPNPADTWLRSEIRAQAEENITIDLVSIDGKAERIYSGITSRDLMVIMTDVSKYSPGLYILRYCSESSSGSKKIVIK
jgi:hypothetical protein